MPVHYRPPVDFSRPPTKRPDNSRHLTCRAGCHPPRDFAQPLAAACTLTLHHLTLGTVRHTSTAWLQQCTDEKKLRLRVELTVLSRDTCVCVCVAGTGPDTRTIASCANANAGHIRSGDDTAKPQCNIGCSIARFSVPATSQKSFVLNDLTAMFTVPKVILPDTTTA